MPQKLAATSAHKAAVFHERDDCHRIERAKGEPTPVSDNAIAFHDLTACPDCVDEYETNDADSAESEVLA
jgi:hypothetical protein